uniref:Transposase n=1 Tax=Heterorhabditis bacteriophora TaxID=37862 RepID=A0A1I7WP46_HETBA
MLLKHTNQYALYSVKVLSPTALADISPNVFRVGDFDVSDRQRFGKPRTLKTDVLKALDENLSQMQEKLADQCRFFAKESETHSRNSRRS